MFHSAEEVTDMCSGCPRPATLLKRIRHRCFPENVAKFLATHFDNISGGCFLFEYYLLEYYV